MSKPIFAAMRIAERVAAGNFTDRIESRRRDELGRLLKSLAVMQASLKARAEEEARADVVEGPGELRTGQPAQAHGG